MNKKIGRNDPCPCGSGKKYKNCHLGQKEPQKTYTPAGKRKFKARVIDVSEKSQDVFNRAATGALEPGDLEALKFRMTDHDYRGKEKKAEKDIKVEETDSKKPTPAKKNEIGDEFEATTENYLEKDE